MKTVHLEYEDARATRALFCNDENLLRELEKAFNVEITTRDAWIRIEGKVEDAQRTELFFQILQNAASHGFSIRKQEFRYVMHALLQGQTPDLVAFFKAGIAVTPNAPPVVPRTDGQRAYLQAMKSHDITFGIGSAGTGKTYLAMALALSELKQEKVSRIILTRPAVEAGEALGFLPGDLQEKILPYLRPLYDALYDLIEASEIQRYIDKGVIEIAPLAYMRGRTLSDSFVILDEAQNTTTEQMFMFLTRLGADSRCVVTGDQTQIDLPNSKRSGLIEVVDVLKGVDGIAFQYFTETDVVRHPLVQSIIRAYKKHRGLQESRL
ncbi:MAG: PhoH family protein [Chthoniobacterales bacterium]